MFKKVMLLTAAAGFAMTTAAFAVENSTKDIQKANKPAAEMKGGDTKMKSGTTGAGATSADPRDSNSAKTPAKSKVDDAKQKQGQ